LASRFGENWCSWLQVWLWGVCVFPLTFAVIHHSYVQGKYCYRFSASDWNEYSLKVSDRKMSPYIPEHSHGINVWHTECYWWATYSCDDDSWKNFQGVCQEKFGLVEARDHPGLPPNEVYAGIEKYKGFKPDHVYQLPIAVNGAQFVCCRNDSTGFVVSWSNRW
jgi:hypothetical protein